MRRKTQNSKIMYWGRQPAKGYATYSYQFICAYYTDYESIFRIGVKRALFMARLTRKYEKRNKR
jgi:hypothetical protein